MARKRRPPQQTPEQISPVQMGTAVFVSAVEAVILSLVLLAVIALLFSLTGMSESFRAYLAGIVSIISLVATTFLAGRRIRARGLVIGGTTGVIFVLLLMVAAHFLPIEFSPGLHMISKLFLGFIFGSLGGILGINF